MTARQASGRGRADRPYADALSALRHYHEALMYIHGLSTFEQNCYPAIKSTASLTKDEVESINKLLSSIYGNIAACHLKDASWPQVIKYSSKALKQNEDNFKARIRRVNAYLSTGALEKAADDLAILLDKQPKDADVQRLRLQWRQLDAEASARQRDEFAGMFDRNKS
ncbi:hypothetical protein SYNPS1DRAFT_29203 [Syncephalis pseudoplumigaleata]|uniref:Uncharacterized protein n=1 Tax=Syncephalis pseudoplumigaleata TaxID=1712513 RepID=A0A4P9Z041_9FUNG|nr:hypothetical protein SYNPS1DRAFT_29203 [Syncephalis pseudoplumigaleata]|eukprot:RKP25051.1 hypothetical protein SYNPS1DRAFT_29203 [Syncephalis pseudoplumigaleata]